VVVAAVPAAGLGDDGEESEGEEEERLGPHL
jgi:hypothetical protein